jgi:hypothetical protein
MKRILLIIGLLWAVVAGAQGVAPGAAQTPWEEVQALPSRVDGICQVYPEPSGVLTPAPKGYKAFYLSHYGRHGSRLVHRDDYYSDPYRMLLAADSAGVLTPLGKSVLSRIERQYGEAKGRCGELTGVGVREHRGIAERMVRNYPSIFRKGAYIDCRSTTSSRVILSMAAHNERLRELCPGVFLTRSASDTYTGLGVSYPMVGRDSIYRRCYELIDARFDREAFARKLFTDPAYAEQVPRLDRDAWHLYFTASNLGCMDAAFDYSDILPLDQMYVFWEATNYLLYSSCSNSPFNSSEVMRCAQKMLADIVSRTDAAVAGEAPAEGTFIRDGATGAAVASGAPVIPASPAGSKASSPVFVPAPTGPVHAADLRFGHDVYLIPLAALLGLSGQHYADPFTTQDVWQYYRVSPMSGNIQLVFYATKKALRHRQPAGRVVAEDVLVKVLLNEEEQLLQTPEGHGLPPAPQPVSGPYYRWSDLRSWFSELLAWPF